MRHVLIYLGIVVLLIGAFQLFWLMLLKNLGDGSVIVGMLYFGSHLTNIELALVVMPLPISAVVTGLFSGSYLSVGPINRSAWTYMPQLFVFAGALYWAYLGLSGAGASLRAITSTNLTFGLALLGPPMIATVIFALLFPLTARLRCRDRHASDGPR